MKWSPGDGFCLTCGSPLSSHSFEYPLNPISRSGDPSDFASLKAGIWDAPAYRELHNMAGQISDWDSLQIASGSGRRLLWFVLAIAAIALSLVPWAWGRLAVILPLLLIVALVGPFFIRRNVKRWAIAAHQVHIINQAAPDGQTAADLLELVRAVSRRAGLQQVPAVGWYESEEMNAFSAGASRNDALVAFSTALLRQMDEASVAAVAAHEIAHVANGDMVTMALVQGTVHAIAFVVALPFQLIGILFSFWEPAAAAAALLVWGVRWVVTSILLIPANLVVRAFSRNRELAADQLAATLVDRDAMVRALEILADDDGIPPINSATQPLAAFKINAPPAWWGELFSTHPSFTRRINALREPAGPEPGRH